MFKKPSKTFSKCCNMFAQKGTTYHSLSTCVLSLGKFPLRFLPFGFDRLGAEVELAPAKGASHG